jgi:hypothetical protein
MELKESNFSLRALAQPSPRIHWMELKDDEMPGGGGARNATRIPPRIHSMELKDLQELSSNKYPETAESIQWNWKLYGQEGGHGGTGESIQWNWKAYSARAHTMQHTLLGIHSMELKVVIQPQELNIGTV